MPPTTLVLKESGWEYHVTLGEMCEPAGGHTDIVGFQTAVPPSGAQHRRRWVRRVGAEISNKLLVQKSGKPCDPDCRPPDMVIA
jgi:hypothetical protein